MSVLWTYFAQEATTVSNLNNSAQNTVNLRSKTTNKNWTKAGVKLKAHQEWIIVEINHCECVWLSEDEFIAILRDSLDKLSDSVLTIALMKKMTMK